MKIKVFTCGGTFEKIYNPISGELGFRESCLPSIIKRSRITLEVDFEELFFKDSLDMDNDDRLIIAQKIKIEPIKNIVVVHGTDTMVQTAQTIKEHTSRDKVVVITGAMLPFSIKESDAMFNLGGAFIAAQTSEPGIWISMNGHIFRSDDVAKNKIKGIFEKA